VHNYPPADELVRESFIPWESRRQSVAYVGGITVQRGICEMVSAMALLPASLPATLELAGPDTPTEVNGDELRQNPGWSRVHHHGLLDHANTFRLLRNARAGLVVLHGQLNHFESMPLKMFEYMGAGLPVIASDFPFWRKLIGETGCGVFVDPMKPSEIAQAIEFVLTHPREAQEMGRRGQAAVLQHFNWESEAAKLVKLYQHLGEDLCAA
jgi:glycosyltransferase involved in cell wall biosynthesis